MRQFLQNLVLWLCVGGVAIAIGLPLAPPTQADGIYTYRQWHDPDGIGKFYYGREIAHVMGHEGLFWLERPSRVFEELPDRTVAALNLTPDAVVADIGAGSGYMSFRIAPLVPDGEVLAVDIQPEMLDYLQFMREDTGLENVTPILGTERDPQLPPNRVDLAIFVDAYHELAYPQEVMSQVVTALKPHGRVVLVEYRREDPLVLIKKLHKMSDRQVRQEMAAVGLTWQATAEFLPQQHVFFFEKVT